MAYTGPRLPCRLAALILVLSCTGARPGRAQSSQAEILAQLKGKPLYLRGMWRRDDLRFTHEGKPVQAYAPDSFSLAGIDVEKVHFSADALEIEGKRVGLEFGKKDGPRRVRLDWQHYNGKISIHIAGHSGEDFGPALAAIFAPDLATLVPSQDKYWARVGGLYLDDDNLDQAIDETANEIAEAAVGASPSTLVHPAEQTTEASPTPEPVSRPMHITGSVRPPVLLSSADPTFSEAARGMRYSGKVEIYLWVEPSGLPSHLRVVRPAGLGLDERALAAVSAYRFRPAMMNGQPTEVEIYVDVNFQIF